MVCILVRGSPRYSRYSCIWSLPQIQFPVSPIQDTDTINSKCFVAIGHWLSAAADIPSCNYFLFRGRHAHAAHAGGRRRGTGGRGRFGAQISLRCYAPFFSASHFHPNLGQKFRFRRSTQMLQNISRNSGLGQLSLSRILLLSLGTNILDETPVVSLNSPPSCSSL